VDGDHQIISDPDGIQSELAYLLINSARIEILGIASQLLLEAIRRVTSRTGQEPPVMLAPIEYYTPAPEIVMAHLSEFAFGRVTRRWKSSLTAFRTMLSGQPDGQGQKPSYTSFSVDELFLDCCLIRLSRNDGTYHLVGLTVLPGVLGREYTIMWQLTSPPADLLKKFDAMLATKAPLIVREVHCKTVDQDVAIKISEGSLATDWQGPEIIQFHPYGVPAGDQNFLMPVAIVAIRAVTPRGTIVYLKRRTPLTDHNDFGVLSLLSARVQEEDLDIALNINLAGKPNDDHVAFEDTWLKAGQPNPFSVPEAAFIHAAQRELYSSCGLHSTPDRLRFRGFQILDHEKTSQQFCFAIFDFALRRSDDQDELRDLELWNPAGMVRIDQDRLYAGPPDRLRLNRLLRVRSDWLTQHVFNRPVGEIGESS